MSPAFCDCLNPHCVMGTLWAFLGPNCHAVRKPNDPCGQTTRRSHAQALQPQAQLRALLTASINYQMPEYRRFQKISAPGSGSRHHKQRQGIVLCPVPTLAGGSGESLQTALLHPEVGWFTATRSWHIPCLSTLGPPPIYLSP